MGATGGNSGIVRVQEGIDFASLMSLVGGPAQFSNLKKIRLYRETPDENGQMVYIIDLTSFLKTGDRSNFPKIKPNDTIVIKKTLTGVLIEDLYTFQTFLSLLHFFSNYIIFLIDMNNQHLDYKSDNANYQIWKMNYI